jgi:hypothetical protein
MWSGLARCKMPIKVEQPGGPGKFEVPAWDPVSQKKIREALLVLASTVTDNTSKAFGSKDHVDPIQRLIGAASAWGANPPRMPHISISCRARMTAKRSINSPSGTCRSTASVSLYNADGYYEKNEYNAYTLNNITAKKGGDGSVTIQFGGCNGSIANCLPTMPGWNYMVRLYRPRAEVLDRTWKFPEAQPAS